MIPEFHILLTVGRVQGVDLLLISTVKRKAAVRNLDWRMEREEWGRKHCTHGGRFEEH